MNHLKILLFFISFLQLSVMVTAAPFSQLVPNTEKQISEDLKSLSCKNVSQQLRWLLTDSDYIGRRSDLRDFFASKKLSQAVAQKTLEKFNKEITVFDKKEVKSLTTKAPNVVVQLIQNDCSWYESLFSSYQKRYQENLRWFENQFIKNDDSDNQSRALLTLKNKDSKWTVSQKDLLRNNQETLKKLQEFFKKNPHPQYNKERLLQEAFRHTFKNMNQKLQKYAYHWYWSIVLNSMDAHSYYFLPTQENLNWIQNAISGQSTPQKLCLSDHCLVETEKVQKESGRITSRLIENHDHKIAYIKIPMFYMDVKNLSYSVFNDFVDAAKKLDPVSDALIIDLRDNTGGSENLVNSILMKLLVTSEFPEMVNGQKICSSDKATTQLKQNQFPIIQHLLHNKIETQYLPFCNKTPYFDNKPLVVLVNDGSASSSEVLALGLQEFGRALIVGSQKTFGKGSGQISTEIHTAYTRAMWLSAFGTSIQKTGVQSDIVIKTATKGYLIESNFPRALPQTHSKENPFSAEQTAMYRAKREKMKSVAKTLNEKSQKRQEVEQSETDPTLAETVQIVKDFITLP